MKSLIDGIAFIVDPDNWTGPRGIGARTIAQIRISLVAVVISMTLATPLAIWFAHTHRFRNVSVALVNLGRSIPSFAIIALVLPFSIRFGFGLGFWPTCVALIALAIPPIYANTYAGIAEAPPETVDAAHGVGMTGGQVLTKVELPASVPLVATGLRVASVQVVATSSLGAIVGYDCLGTFIVAGLPRGSAGRAEVIAGAILIAALALVVDIAMERAQHRLTPWQRRLR